ncbi:hypothetical protein JG687_00013084 [Phytophthora cactorum]|uniref:Uncharacterized protein n=1 Tax=Phytophthora cactorum TaxID=29920 RepID=A0A8T1U2E6_9STRA|nr:hypothetical protein JG687_00013084 [Phytophthora cactorum]
MALRNQCCGYAHLDDLIRIASEGVHVKLNTPLPKQARFLCNHPSAANRINVLRTNISKEQDLRRCLVVDASSSELFLSPFVRTLPPPPPPPPIFFYCTYSCVLLPLHTTPGISAQTRSRLASL